jgi:hypothetical protein
MAEIERPTHLRGLTMADVDNIRKYASDHIGENESLGLFDIIGDIFTDEQLEDEDFITGVITHDGLKANFIWGGRCIEKYGVVYTPDMKNITPMFWTGKSGDPWDIIPFKVEVSD